MNLIQSNKYEECVLQGKEAMGSYFNKYGIEWNFEQRLEIYKTLELYEVFDSVAIGFIVFREKGGEFYLADFLIFEKYQNRGYGTKLLSEVKKIARRRQYRRVLLKVFKSNPAVRLYERNGFKIIKKEKHLYLLESNI